MTESTEVEDDSTGEDPTPARRTSMPPVQPALPTLQLDQEALIRSTSRLRADESCLRDGFQNRREVIHWYQRAIVRTFGSIADEFPATDLLRDHNLLACFIIGPERESYLDSPPSESTARKYRLMFETEILLPACNEAYNWLRKRAGEYTPKDSAGRSDSDSDELTPDDLDPKSQRYLAMRPGFQQKDEAQADALRKLWGGFDGIESLLDWVHGLDQPTNGSIEADLASELMRDEHARSMLLGGSGVRQARVYREWFAIAYLLPAFTEGIRNMEAGELVARQRRKTHGAGRA